MNVSRTLQSCLLTSLILLAGCKPGSSSSVELGPDEPVAPAPVARRSIELVPVGGHKHGDTLGAEISAFDTVSGRLLTVNAGTESIDIQDLSDPHAPKYLKSLSVAHLGRPTSVAARQGKIAVAVMGKAKGEKGHVLFLDAEGIVLQTLEVDYEPDMLTFSKDGNWLLVANEGEPETDYKVDPPGSVSVIDVRKPFADLTSSDVTDVGFQQFDSQRESLDPSVRIYAKAQSVSQDIEPEYITISADSRTAWVTCQENNAIAILDIESKSIVALKGLGFKDHSLPGQGLDASDKDGKIRIRNWPVMGMYQPDGIASFAVDGQTYLVTANEGELRQFSALDERARVLDLKLNPKNFSNIEAHQNKKNLGRLRVSSAFGDTNSDGLHEVLYSAGGRSFSIWSSDVELIFDSGDQFERILAEQLPQYFNSDHEAANFDDRSDNKGCEPESVAIGVVNGRTYAFIGLERVGGIMVYDVSIPRAPVFECYVNTRDFEKQSGDNGPEGILFVSAEESGCGFPLLVVSYEISGTTRIFEVRNHSQLTAISPSR